LLLGAAAASQTSSGRRILAAVGGLTVGHRHDTDRPAPCQQLGEQPTHAEGLVVRMRRDHHDVAATAEG